MSAFEDILDDPPATINYDEDPFGDPTPVAETVTETVTETESQQQEPEPEPQQQEEQQQLTSEPEPDVVPTTITTTVAATTPVSNPVDIDAAIAPAALAKEKEVDFEPSGTFLEVKLRPESSEFDINVKDPEKKGEGINSYIVYTIETKTTSKNFSSPNMTVSRRFTNFVWLFNQLTIKYPGVIVPPIPEKQALGRFESEFLDLRRSQLEKCLRKIAAHPELSKSNEFKMFLESKDLEGDIKKNEPKKGFFSQITSSVTEAVSTATSTFAKIPEPDEWFDTKKSQIEVFDAQLKVLDKVLDVFIKQRKDLAISIGEFGESVSSLGTSEFNKSLSSCLNHLGEVEKKIKDLHVAQSEHESSNLRFIVDEYIRTVDSIKIALNARVKQYQAWKAADANLIKKKEQLAKLTQQGKSGKAVTLEAEVAEDEKNLEKAKSAFDNITELVKKELQRFDLEKVQDFRASLLQFVESTMETQKKIIALWETYLPEVQAI